jgi:hypothetical protein
MSGRKEWSLFEYTTISTIDNAPKMAKRPILRMKFEHPIHSRSEEFEI